MSFKRLRIWYKRISFNIIHTPLLSISLGLLAGLILDLRLCLIAILLFIIFYKKSAILLAIFMAIGCCYSFHNSSYITNTQAGSINRYTQIQGQVVKKSPQKFGSLYTISNGSFDYKFILNTNLNLGEIVSVSGIVQKDQFDNTGAVFDLNKPKVINIEGADVFDKLHNTIANEISMLFEGTTLKLINNILFRDPFSVQDDKTSITIYIVSSTIVLVTLNELAFHFLKHFLKPTPATIFAWIITFLFFLITIRFNLLCNYVICLLFFRLLAKIQGKPYQKIIAMIVILTVFGIESPQNLLNVGIQLYIFINFLTFLLLQNKLIKHKMISNLLLFFFITFLLILYFGPIAIVSIVVPGLLYLLRKPIVFLLLLLLNFVLFSKYITFPNILKLPFNFAGEGLDFLISNLKGQIDLKYLLTIFLTLTLLILLIYKNSAKFRKFMNNKKFQ